MKAGAVLLMTAAVVLAAVSIAPKGTSALGVAGQANAYASLAAEGPYAVIAWGASGTSGGSDIYVAASRDAGRTFGTPQRVNGDTTRANLAGEQPPRVSLTPRSNGEPAIVVVWTARGQDGTRLVSARSHDLGATFGPAADVPGSIAAGNRGWHAVATDASRAFVFWLDHRETAAPPGSAPAARHQHGTHAMPARDGVARAQLSKLFVATLDGAIAGTPITGGVCYCCKTTTAVGPDGAIYAAWRHVYPGSLRDIAFTMSTDNGRTFSAPVRVSEDGWAIDGCPENGPSMTIARDGRIHIVWPTLVDMDIPGREPTMALFHATSADGQRFSARERIPTEGFPKHPQMTLAAGGELVATWDEQLSDGDRRIAAASGRADQTGRVRFRRRDVVGSGEYPAVASANGGTLVAWTSGDGSRTTIGVARLP
jgi:hypothetical protein